MANNFDSNFTRKVMEKTIDPFNSQRVISKNVNTQLFAGEFNPQSGEVVDIKRPTDYNIISTSDGDISTTRSDIINGKASATVQNYITVAVDYKEVDEALKMGSTTEMFDSIGRRMVVSLETQFAAFAMKHTALLQGTVGQGVNAWSEIANAGALMESTGVPQNKPWCYFLNSYSQAALADAQRGLGVNPTVSSANEKATVMENFAGFSVKTANTLATYSAQAGADRVGALTSAPDVTYVTHKDTMQQSLVLKSFTNGLVIKAGEQIQITGRNRLNLSTRQPIIDSAGANVVFTATVVADVTLSGTGTGTIVVSGPAIYEAAGAYNTVDSSPTTDDVVTILGAASTTYQPNMFWHPDAFAIASVPLQKLYSTDTLATTQDGLQIRCSKFSDGSANKQTVRFDMLPAFGVLNPFFAGQGFGVA
jgi:hypothetical protein